MGKFRLKTSRISWVPDRAFFAFLVVIVNAANLYLVPLIANFGLPAADVPDLQGFLTLVLNGLVVYLGVMESEAPGPPPPQT